MAKVQGKVKAVSAPIVYCEDCKHFVRDTEGISRSSVTGEYFMGKCKLFHGKDNHPYRLKVFASKPRSCEKFVDKKISDM